MAVAFTKQQTSDDYTDAATLLLASPGGGGAFIVESADAFMQILSGPVGREQWSAELAVLSAVGGIGQITRGASGVRFRSLVAGQPATVTAQLFTAGEPTASGVAGAAARGITGVNVELDGALVGTETGLNLITGPDGNLGWTVEDDPTNKVVKVTPELLAKLVTRYSRLTSNAVNDTVAATDLLNGEITIAASKLTAGKRLSGLLWGDLLNDTGATRSGPRFQLILDTTTVADFGPVSSRFGNSTVRHGWVIRVDVLAVTSASQLWLVEYHDVAGATDAAGSATATSVAITSGTSGGLVEVDQATQGNLSTAVVSGSSAVDMTSAQGLICKVINAVASTEYETRLNGAVFDIT